MVRDGVALQLLASISAPVSDGGPTSGVCSVVAKVAECKPVCWSKTRRSNRLVEYFEFFLSDDSRPLFKVRCWGAAALHVAARVVSEAICLLDRLEVVQDNQQSRYGVWVWGQTSLSLLGTPQGGLLLDSARHPVIARRAEAVMRHGGRGGGCSGPPPAAVYCRNFEEIQEGRLIEVDVCLSITLGEELSRRAAPCVDLTGAELHLCFSTAAEGMSLRGALLESAGRRHGGVRGGVRAWLVARKLLVRWWEHGKIRDLNTTIDSRFEIFCFEQPAASDADRRGVCVVPPVTGGVRHPATRRRVHLTWGGFCDAMEDAAKIDYLCGRLVILRCSIRELSLPGGRGEGFSRGVDLRRLIRLSPTAVSGGTKRTLYGRTAGIQTELCSVPVDATFRSTYLTISHPVYADRGVCGGQLYRESSFRRVSQSRDSCGSALDDRSVALEPVPEEAEAGGVTESFVEDLAAPVEGAFCVEVTGSVLSERLCRGIPAAAVAAQYIDEIRKDRAREMICQPHTAEGADCPSAGQSRIDNSAFDFRAACARVLAGLQRAADETETLEMVLEVRRAQGLSDTGCALGRASVFLLDILP